ncbi:trihelix transcription factor PTL [Punica granatum]|uniref:Uncharacterized protein n=2 Tax=Punica granatum TaxID=22663 RepID=A0A2I0HLU8_PUNGR|nr:trihelix transcription factor PTL [Punica granatum]PKI32658.1 hypothetical protein CRG98_046968 [Punica granatum]
MDGHHQHHPYGMADFRQLMTGAPPPPELFPSHHRGPQPMEIMMAAAAGHQMKVHGRGSAAKLHEFPTDNSPAAAAFEGGDFGSARWPRQETLTLLEIRSRLDSRFREANQKGPLWDEVSRIMSEEHGYQRTGKKCREKFENLYKYYKKTKEGKAGRQDGKHYRFFRQLEALYGDHTSSNASMTACSVPEAQGLVNSLGSYHPSIISPQLVNASGNNHETASHQSQKASDSLSLPGSSDFDTSSSNDDNTTSATDLMVENISEGRNTRAKKRRGGRSWKVKIKDFIDSRIRKLMEKQEAWVEKMMRALEEKEQERLLREEEWRTQEIARIDKEHKFWAKERAWIEARDAAIMEALHNLTSRSSSSDNNMMSIDNHHIPVCMENGKGTAAHTDRLGDQGMIDGFLKRSKEYYDKKHKENISRCGSNNYFHGDNDSLYNQGGVAYCEISEQGPETARVHHQLNDGTSPSNLNAGNPVQDSCFRFLMGDGGSLWENYGMKLTKGEN